MRRGAAGRFRLGRRCPLGQQRRVSVTQVEASGLCAMAVLCVCGMPVHALCARCIELC